MQGSFVVKRRLRRRRLSEDRVLEEVWRRCPALERGLRPNVRSLFSYAFLEMLNNAIEHSGSTWIELSVMRGSSLSFVIRDFGIGAFRNIQRKKALRTEWEALQHLLKGKQTTDPERHSGEGIFFTSKLADVFHLESFGLRLTTHGIIGDVFVEEVAERLRGTEVAFQIDIRSRRDMMEIFRAYQTDAATFAFDRTAVRARLFATPDAYLSRSQARRLLTGLDRFRVVELDFSGVPMIGQAFADEVFRVFSRTHPDVTIQPKNMTSAVAFMVGRAKGGR
jgi:hypothetical protein